MYYNGVFKRHYVVDPQNQHSSFNLGLMFAVMALHENRWYITEFVRLLRVRILPVSQRHLVQRVFYFMQLKLITRQKKLLHAEKFRHAQINTGKGELKPNRK
jgi:hypothetical protein